MNKIIKKFIGLSLRKMGYQLCGINSQTNDKNCLSKYELIKENEHYINKYKDVIREIEGLYKEFLFRDIPASDEKKVILMSKLLGTQISEAIYILNYLHKSLNLEGDVCEFGVAQGATSTFLANEIRSSNKNLWLFDSFQGLPKPSKKDILKDDMFKLGSIEAYEGTMFFPIAIVKQKLIDINFPLSRIKIIPGFIEETIKKSDIPNKICFAYVDFDFYEPILITLNFLDKVLQKNGFVIVDDYGFFSTGAKTAVDEFIELNKQKYNFHLPIKPAGYFCILEKIA